MVSIQKKKFGKKDCNFKPSYFPIKVEKILKGNLDSILSPSPSMKIQVMGGKICFRYKGETLMGVVNKLLKTKSLLTTHSNVLPLCLKQTFPLKVKVIKSIFLNLFYFKSVLPGREHKQTN